MKKISILLLTAFFCYGLNAQSVYASYFSNSGPSYFNGSSYFYSYTSFSSQVNFGSSVDFNSHAEFNSQTDFDYNVDFNSTTDFYSSAYFNSSAYFSSSTSFSSSASFNSSVYLNGSSIYLGSSSTIRSSSGSGGLQITSGGNVETQSDLIVLGNDIISSSGSTVMSMSSDDATFSDDLIVNGDVTVSSDARLKANITSLGSTIAKLLLIDGKSYTMKKDGKSKIGVLAQDIQKVFPELVTVDKNDMLAVNYQGLVPVLINALKEQQLEIENLKEQEKKYIEQESRLSKLEDLILNKQ